MSERIKQLHDDLMDFIISNPNGGPLWISEKRSKELVNELDRLQALAAIVPELGERMLLTIDRKVTVECGNCDKDGEAFNYLIDMMELCQRCHGTGELERRLRGWVEVANPGHADVFWVREPSGNGNLFTGDIDWLRRKLTAAFLANELPAEIAGNLELTGEATDAE